MKTSSGSLRRSVLFVALVASLGAAFWTHWNEGQSLQDDVVQAVSPVQSRATDATTENLGLTNAAALVSSSDFPERGAIKVSADPFSPLAIAPIAAPVPVIVAAVAAPPPSAPALPFQYVGKLEQSLKTVVYLNRGADSYSVLPGDNIDANYRFVGIEGDNLVFLYLPLSQRQTLPFGP